MINDDSTLLRILRTRSEDLTCQDSLAWEHTLNDDRERERFILLAARNSSLASRCFAIADKNAEPCMRDSFIAAMLIQFANSLLESSQRQPMIDDNFATRHPGKFFEMSTPTVKQDSKPWALGPITMPTDEPIT